MTREEMIAELHAITHARDNRGEIWRVIVDEHGVPTGEKIYRGSFQRLPEPPSQGEQS